MCEGNRSSVALFRNDMRRAKQASKTWTIRYAAHPERKILAEFTGAHVQVVSLRFNVKSVRIPLSENARSKLYNNACIIELFCDNLVVAWHTRSVVQRIAALGNEYGCGGEIMSKDATACADALRARGARRSSRRSVQGITRERMSVNVTSSERALIEEGAKIRGVSISRYLVDGALHPVTIDGSADQSNAELVELLRGYRRQLEGAMTNVNQVAHHANTMREVPEEFGSTVRSLAVTLTRINDMLASVGR